MRDSALQKAVALLKSLGTGLRNADQLLSLSDDQDTTVQMTALKAAK
ncbi:MAG: hypothetical protein JO189_30875 [Deltaproteobacteria bacterium]|nr:hypothetical protein [Deltaproteobacteria bacterium]